MEINIPFGGIYRGKRVLVTGNTGFKGSWLALWLHQLGAEVIGYSQGIVSRPSHFSALKIKYRTYFHDIRDTRSLDRIVQQTKPEIVFHLAAQSLVRESYRDPVETYEVNVLGTLYLLEAVRRSGGVKGVINVTTDKVYENLEKPVAYRESDRLGGFDLYSSSKACSELLSSSYRRAFFSSTGTLLATARAGNVIGGGDWALERLVPDMMRAAVAGRTCSIRNTSSIRPWQHVLEPLSGYLQLGKGLLMGHRELADAFNFGPGKRDCISVGQLIQHMQPEWKKIKCRIRSEKKTNLHEAGILQLNATKVHKKLGWRPVWTIADAAKSTVRWYKSYSEENAVLSYEDLHKFQLDAMVRNPSFFS